jgi:hypothetical protein
MSILLFQKLLCLSRHLLYSVMFRVFLDLCSAMSCVMFSRHLSCNAMSCVMFSRHLSCNAMACVMFTRHLSCNTMSCVMFSRHLSCNAMSCVVFSRHLSCNAMSCVMFSKHLSRIYIIHVHLDMCPSLNCTMLLLSMYLICPAAPPIEEFTVRIISGQLPHIKLSINIYHTQFTIEVRIVLITELFTVAVSAELTCSVSFNLVRRNTIQIRFVACFAANANTFYFPRKYTYIVIILQCKTKFTNRQNIIK